MSSGLEVMSTAFLQDAVLSAAALLIIYRMTKSGADPVKAVFIGVVCSILRLIPHALIGRGFVGFSDAAIFSAAACFVSVLALTTVVVKDGLSKAFFSAAAYTLFMLLASSVALHYTGASVGLMQNNSYEPTKYVFYDSDYMAHTNSSWRTYLVERGIPEEVIESFPFRSGISRGHTIKVVPPQEIRLGDIILYKTRAPEMDVMDRVVGIVGVKGWDISSIEGTLGCMNEEEFKATYLQPLRDCIINNQNCPYVVEDKNSFRLYITKADNLGNTDQCSGILPVLETQITGKAVE